MTDCPTCEHTLDTEQNNETLADDEYHDYFCPRCGNLYEESQV